MKELTFYRCNHCGNLVVMIHDAGVNPVCCGVPMEKLEAGSVDATVEKHVPVVEMGDSHITVHVGEKDHPMEEEHLIEWVCYEQENGNFKVKYLKPGDKPEVTFGRCSKCAAPHGIMYAYCNLHGLWKAEF